MNTLHLTRLAIFVVLGINFTNSSPLERLKRALVARRSACPPGIWTCLYGTQHKRNRMLNQPQKSIDQPAQLISKGSGRYCPPGIWTCVNGEPAEGQKRLVLVNSQSDTSVKAAAPREPAEEVKRSHPITSDNDAEIDEDDELNTDRSKCPHAVGVCKRKRALRRMMEEAKRRVQRSSQKCPPGIWVC